MSEPGWYQIGIEVDPVTYETLSLARSVVYLDLERKHAVSWSDVVTWLAAMVPVRELLVAALEGKLPDVVVMQYVRRVLGESEHPVVAEILAKSGRVALARLDRPHGNCKLITMEVDDREDQGK